MEHSPSTVAHLISHSWEHLFSLKLTASRKHDGFPWPQHVFPRDEQQVQRTGFAARRQLQNSFELRVALEDVLDHDTDPAGAVCAFLRDTEAAELQSLDGACGGEAGDTEARTVVVDDVRVPVPMDLVDQARFLGTNVSQQSRSSAKAAAKVERGVGEEDGLGLDVDLSTGEEEGGIVVVLLPLVLLRLSDWCNGVAGYWAQACVAV